MSRLAITVYLFVIFLLFIIEIYFTGRHLELTSPITSSTGGGHSSHPSHLTSGGVSSNQQQQLPSSSSLHPHAPHTPSQSAALKSPASAAALFSHFYDGGSNPVTQNPRLQPPSHLYPRTPSKLNNSKFIDNTQFLLLSKRPDTKYFEFGNSYL